eukprot:m.110055 g.110055  ORF g.110055 m.110055 type:complete len:293 (-) comp13385_c0_seq1:168-1046(-)
MRYPDMPDVELCIQMALFLRSPAVFPPPSNWQYVRQSEPLPDVSDQVLGEQDESALLPLFTQEEKYQALLSQNAMLSHLLGHEIRQLSQISSNLQPDTRHDILMTIVHLKQIANRLVQEPALLQVLPPSHQTSGAATPQQQRAARERRRPHRSRHRGVSSQQQSGHPAASQSAQNTTTSTPSGGLFRWRAQKDELPPREMHTISVHSAQAIEFERDIPEQRHTFSEFQPQHLLEEDESKTPAYMVTARLKMPQPEQLKDAASEVLAAQNQDLPDSEAAAHTVTTAIQMPHTT